MPSLFNQIYNSYINRDTTFEEDSEWLNESTKGQIRQAVKDIVNNIKKDNKVPDDASQFQVSSSNENLSKIAKEWEDYLNIDWQIQDIFKKDAGKMLSDEDFKKKFTKSMVMSFKDAMITAVKNKSNDEASQEDSNDESDNSSNEEEQPTTTSSTNSAELTDEQIDKIAKEQLDVLKGELEKITDDKGMINDTAKNIISTALGEKVKEEVDSSQVEKLQTNVQNAINNIGEQSNDKQVQ